MTSQRAELLALAEKQDAHTVVEFVKNAKQKAKDLQETLAECSQRQREDLWESLRKVCTDILLDDHVEDSEEEEKKKKADHYIFLDCLVTLTTATLQQKEVNLPQAFLDTAALLHGVLLTLPEEADTVKYRLAHVFESWFQHSRPGWQDVTANTLLYFLTRSLAKGTVNDVKSVWRLHSVLMLVNFDAPSAAELRNLLGRCCSAAHYVKLDEGRRFLSYVLTLNAGIMDSMHRAIKNQIPYAPKSWLSWYGDVYFRAWQKSSGDMCQKLENDCIQDIMNHAIHASREGKQPMSSTLFRVMNHFHRQKKQRGVDSMLLRLYNPILWRALTVPNTEVRANSASLLLDAFPLQDPDATAEETDTLIQKQFDLMQRLLADPCPVVRGLAGEGVCGVLSHFMEMIPADVVQTLLCKLLKELAWDTASPTVRLAVVKGISSMLDNPMCHLLLKPLLPGLSLCLHDKTETVRIAMLDLLIKVKGIRSIKYWNISPIEHLLARLESDSQPVVRRVVELLFPSFLPLDQNALEQVSRCMTLIESNHNAARVFFLHAPRHLTLTDTVKYMALLCRYVLESVRSMNQSLDSSELSDTTKSEGRGGKKRRDNSSQGSDNDNDDDDDDDDDNNEAESEERLSPEMLQGLLEAIFLMWTAVAKQLDAAENKELKQSIMKKLSVTVPEVLKVTQDPKVISLVVEIAGHLPAKTVPTISRSCLSKLRNMPEDSVDGDYAEILEAVCLWEMAPQVLQLLSDWLEDSLTPTQAPPPLPPSQPEKKKGKSGKKCVQITAPEDAKRPHLALDYMKSMLTSAVCKRVLMESHLPLMVKFNKLLSRVLMLVEKELEEGKGSDLKRTSFLDTVFSLHLRLSVLLHNPEEDEGEDCVTYMKTVLEWAQRTLVVNALQAINKDSEDDSEATTTSVKTSSQTHLASTCVLTTLNICSHMLMLGMGDKSLLTHIVSLCQPLLNKNSHLSLVEQSLGCLHQAILFEELEAGEVVVKCMSVVMVALNACLHRPHVSTDPKVFGNVKSKISGVVASITGRHGNTASANEKDVAIVTELTSTMLSAVLAELQHGSQQDTLTTRVEETDSLPPVSTCLLTCFSRNTPCRRLFIEEMENCVKSGAITDVHTTHAIVHLLLALHSKGTYHKGVDLSPLQSAVSDLVQQTSQRSSDDMDVDEDVFRDVMATIQTKMQSIVGKHG